MTALRGEVGGAAGVEAPGRIELHSIDVVPLSERHGSLRSLGAVWFVANVNLTAMATGIVALALGGTLFWTLLAVVVWSLFGTIFMAFHSTQGPHLGLPQLVAVPAAVRLRRRGAYGFCVCAGQLGFRSFGPYSSRAP